jgi:hypothetical protein
VNDGTELLPLIVVSAQVESCVTGLVGFVGFVGLVGLVGLVLLLDELVSGLLQETINRTMKIILPVLIIVFIRVRVGEEIE